VIVGIGVDLLRRDRMARSLLNDESPFVRRTYTAAERVEATGRETPADYYISRFCAKEAVFKALGADPQHARLLDIEVLSGELGELGVALHGQLRRHAQRRGIARVHVSLTYETDHVLSFAVAEAPSMFSAGPAATPMLD
jgi:phosphopantetheine--protein transferase-like protein